MFSTKLYVRRAAAASLAICFGVVFSAGTADSAILMQSGAGAVAFEAEDADSIITTGTESWLIASIDNPIGQTPQTPPIDILPATSNASGGAALFAEYGVSGNESRATYRIKFDTPGDYKFYLRTSSFDSTQSPGLYGNEDSLFRPVDDGFNIDPLDGNGGTAFGTQSYKDGQYGWITGGPTYTVTPADVAAGFVEFRLDTRERGFSFDRVVFSTDTGLGAAELDAASNSAQGTHGPFLLYQFEPADGHAGGPVDATALDFSGHGRDGTLGVANAGSYTYQTDTPAALAGSQSLLLSQSGSDAARLSVDIPTSELDFSNESWTISTWFNRATNNTNDFLFHLGSGDGNELYLFGPQNSDNLGLSNYYTPDGGSSASHNIDLTVSDGAMTDVWNHVAVVHDAENGEMLLYLNGAQVGLDDGFSLNLPQGGNSPTLIVGGHDNPNYAPDRWFDGGLDDFALWAKALSASDIMALSRGMSPLAVPEPTSLGLIVVGLFGLGVVRRRRR